MEDAKDWAAILALNQAHEAETSHLDDTSLRALASEAFFFGVRDEGRTGFLIAFDQNANYHSPNFLWFKERYPRFVYIDRIIVDIHARGQGVGRGLYSELTTAALKAGHTMITCEVNIQPPNPTSDLFHAALGFKEAGRANIAAGKTVRYMTLRIPTSVLS